jgi:hypothetical protein
MPPFNKFTLKILDIRGSQSFQLPARETYILKIFGDDIPEKVYFNSSRIVHSIFRNRTKLKEFYYIITPVVSKQGANSIRIIPDNRYSIKIMNNIASTDFGTVLLKQSAEKKSKTDGTPYLSAAFLSVVWGLAILYLLRFLFGLSIDSFFFNNCLSYIPCILFLTFLYKILALIPAQLLFSNRNYMGIVVFLILIFQIPALFNFIVREIGQRYRYPDLIKEKEVSSLPEKSKLKSIGSTSPIYSVTEYNNIYIDFLKILRKNAPSQFLGYGAAAWFLRKDFSDKFILFFIAFLFTSAFFLSFNLSFFSEFLASMAYLSLVSGVIIKLKNAKFEPIESRPA